MINRLDIEAEFGDYVRNIGGDVVSDLVGPSPDYPNADFLFRNNSIVAELKCIQDDKSEDLQIQSKIQSLFDRWMSEGTIPTMYGDLVRVNSKNLPQGCQQALAEVYKIPIQRRIQKANKQIKATGERLRIPGYRGLLLLANDGNYAIESNAILYLVWRVLGTSFRNITDVVYFTVNMPATSPFTSKPTLVWAHATRPHLSGIEPDFMDRLRQGWFDHLERTLGQPIDAMAIDMHQLDQVRYRG